MTDCPNAAFRDQLPDLVSGRISPEARRELEAHLRSCAECTAELALLRGLRASMARVPAIDAERIAALVPAYRAPARRSWGSWRAAASIVAVVAAGASAIVVQRGAQDRRAALPAASVAVGATGSTTPAMIASAPPLAAPAPPTEGEVRRTTAAPRELALASVATSDLSDRELQTLLESIESIDAVPSVDVENAVPVSPVSPRKSSE